MLFCPTSVEYPLFAFLHTLKPPHHTSPFEFDIVSAARRLSLLAPEESAVFERVFARVFGRHPDQRDARIVDCLSYCLAEVTCLPEQD